jgi:hypothetical protein
LRFLVSLISSICSSFNDVDSSDYIASIDRIFSKLLTGNYVEGRPIPVAARSKA